PDAIARLGEHGAAAARGGYARFAARIGLAAAPIASFTRELARTIEAFSPDVVHSNGLKLHVLAARTGVGVPLVWHVHDYVGRRRVTARLLRWNRSRCAAVVANSRSVADDVRASIGDGIPIVPIHNAVDLTRFAPTGPRSGPRRRRRVNRHGRRRRDDASARRRGRARVRHSRARGRSGSARGARAGGADNGTARVRSLPSRARAAAGLRLGASARGPGRMKILHVYSGNLYGGIETVLVTLARHRALSPELTP